MLLFINIGLIICTLGAAASGLGGETWDKDKKHLPLPYRFTPRGWTLLIFIVSASLLGVFKEFNTRAENRRRDAEVQRDKAAERNNQKTLEDQLQQAQAKVDETNKKLDKVRGQETIIQDKADKAQGTLNATRDKLEKTNTANLISSLVGSQKLASEIWFVAPTEKSIDSESEFENILRKEMGTPTCSLNGTKIDAYFRLPPETLVASDLRYAPSDFTVVEGTTEKEAIIRTSSVKGPWKDFMTYAGLAPFRAAYVVKITPRGGEKFSAASFLSQVTDDTNIFGYYASGNPPQCMEKIKPHDIRYLRVGILFLVLDKARNETIMVSLKAAKTEVYTGKFHDKILRVGFEKYAEPALISLQFAKYTDEISQLLDAQGDSDLVIY